MLRYRKQGKSPSDKVWIPFSVILVIRSWSYFSWWKLWRKITDSSPMLLSTIISSVITYMKSLKMGETTFTQNLHSLPCYFISKDVKFLEDSKFIKERDSFITNFIPIWIIHHLPKLSTFSFSHFPLENRSNPLAVRLFDSEYHHDLHKLREVSLVDHFLATSSIALSYNF